MTNIRTETKQKKRQERERAIKDYLAKKPARKVQSKVERKEKKRLRHKATSVIQWREQTKGSFNSSDLLHLPTDKSRKAIEAILNGKVIYTG